MISSANNARKFALTLAAQNYHGSHIISRNFHSIKAYTWSKQHPLANKCIVHISRLYRNSQCSFLKEPSLSLDFYKYNNAG